MKSKECRVCKSTNLEKYCQDTKLNEWDNREVVTCEKGHITATDYRAR